MSSVHKMHAHILNIEGTISVSAIRWATAVTDTVFFGLKRELVRNDCKSNFVLMNRNAAYLLLQGDFTQRVVLEIINHVPNCCELSRTNVVAVVTS